MVLERWGGKEWKVLESYGACVEMLTRAARLRVPPVSVTFGCTGDGGGARRLINWSSNTISTLLLLLISEETHIEF